MGKAVVVIPPPDTSRMNFEGPLPPPLDRFQLTIAEGDQPLVDKSMTFNMQAGVEPDEHYP